MFDFQPRKLGERSEKIWNGDGTRTIKALQIQIVKTWLTYQKNDYIEHASPEAFLAQHTVSHVIFQNFLKVPPLWKTVCCELDINYIRILDLIKIYILINRKSEQEGLHIFTHSQNRILDVRQPLQYRYLSIIIVYTNACIKISLYFLYVFLFFSIQKIKVLLWIKKFFLGIKLLIMQ